MHGSEKIHQERNRRSLRALEQERRPLFTNNALYNLRDFELGIDLDAHALELSLQFQKSDELLQIRERHKPRR